MLALDNHSLWGIRHPDQRTIFSGDRNSKEHLDGTVQNWRSSGSELIKPYFSGPDEIQKFPGIIRYEENLGLLGFKKKKNLAGFSLLWDRVSYSPDWHQTQGLSSTSGPLASSSGSSRIIDGCHHCWGMQYCMPPTGLHTQLCYVLSVFQALPHPCQSWGKAQCYPTVASCYCSNELKTLPKFSPEKSIPSN